MKLVIGRYENYGSWTGGLVFYGEELTRERILSIDSGAYAWTPQSEGNLCGFMKILASSKEEAETLFKNRLQEKFEAVGLKVEYRGKVGIPKESPTMIGSELRKLVRKTLVDEALGKIEPDSIREI